MHFIHFTHFILHSHKGKGNVSAPQNGKEKSPHQYVEPAVNRPPGFRRKLVGKNISSFIPYTFPHRGEARIMNQQHSPEFVMEIGNFQHQLLANIHSDSKKQSGEHRV